MIKKILITLLLIIGSLFFISSNLYADGDSRKQCEGDAGKTKFHCRNFEINMDDFSPGGTGTLTRIREGEGNVAVTTNIVLQDIIKNMIIVFGVLSLFVITIGGGFMIFHVGEETYLSKGKTMIKYGVISLALALASGVMVNVVNWLLF